MSSRKLLLQTFMFCICLLSTLVCLPQVVVADILDNRGREFLVAFTHNYTTPNLEVHLTSDVPTNVTVEYPVNSPSFSSVVAVTPGTITTVTLPSDAAQAWVNDTAQNNLVHLSSSDEFVAYAINRAPFSSDAALALPVDTFNTEYIVTTYDEPFLSAEFVVVAAFDATTVTITPSRDAKNGHAAGVPFDVVLNRGEGYMVQNLLNGPNGGLAGSIVTANKPVGLSNGNGCTQVPYGTAYCDAVFEIAQPVQTWGSSTVVVNLPNRPSGSRYRVLASQDATEIFLDGVSQGSINRGEFMELGSLPDSHVVSGSHPIFVTQFMTGSTSPGATLGDPAQGNMIPPAQFLNQYTFSTVGGQQFAQHFLTLIVNNADLSNISLDGVPVGSGVFSPILGSDYSSAVVALTEGTHTTASVSPHGITVEGYNQDDSYLYPGGARFAFINPQGDANPPICNVSFLAGPPQSFTGTATDNRPTEDINNNHVLDQGEDLNGNGQIDKDSGVFFVELTPDSSNLSLNVDAFIPGAGQVGFSVSLVDPNVAYSGTVKVTDGAGNTCVSPLSALDCNGVFNGNAVVDRCGVCGGDGTSCLQCANVNILSDQFVLDGRAASLKNLAEKVAAALRKAGAKKSVTNALKTSASASYNDAWVATWTLPPAIANCQNAEFCVQSNHSDTLQAYQNSISDLTTLINNALNKLKKRGVNIDSYKKSLSKNLKIINSTTSTIPATSSFCG